MTDYLSVSVDKQLGEQLTELCELAGCDYDPLIQFYLSLGLAFAGRLWKRPDVTVPAFDRMAQLARHHRLLPTVLGIEQLPLIGSD